MWSDALPLAAVVLLLATGRVSLLRAGLAALAVTMLAGWLTADSGLTFDRLAIEWMLAARAGAWIAWQAIAIIVAGLAFYHMVRAAQPRLFALSHAAKRRPGHRQIFGVCFLLGPFVEAATGFGVGLLITLAAVSRLGLTGIPALSVALFSQMLVPWGALAIGTFIGADLAGIEVRALGMASAVLCMPLLLAYLLVFWRLAAAAGVEADGRDRVADVAWTLGLGVSIYLANRFVSVDTAVVLAGGVLAAWHYALHGDRAREQRRAVLLSALPYIAFTTVLLATRLVPPIETLLVSALVLDPLNGVARFPVLHHASFWLLVSVCACAPWAGRDAGRAAGRALRASLTPVLVTLVFVIMGELLNASGAASRLAAAWAQMAGGLAAAGAPLLGAVAGGLTGSNSASNAMLMPLQVQLAFGAGDNPLLLAALQNTSGSNATMFSPVRVAMGLAFLGLAGRERDAYRAVLPLGAVTLLVLVAFAMASRLW